MSEMQHKRGDSIWWFVLILMAVIVSNFIGFARGHEAGRREMADYIMCVVDKLGGSAPAKPGASAFCARAKSHD